MMHYRKGENVEQELKKEDLPFEDCLSKLPQKDFLWMHVKGGTKTHNVIDYAKNALDKGEYRTVVWSGSGGGVVKTVSCAEILKRSFPLHQLTRMDQITIEEHWVPQMEGLEPIVAKRKVPSLHILMTLDPIDESIPDVQRPNTTTEFWRGVSDVSEDTQQKKQQQQRRRPGPNTDGQSQRQRHQRPKQPQQGSQAEQRDGDASTNEQQRERQQRPNKRNRNRGGGEQRRGQNGNGSNEQQQQPRQEVQQEGQSTESSQQSQQQSTVDGQQERPSAQSQKHRRPKSKQKQQQQSQPSTQAMQAETVSASSAPNISTAGEPMES